MIKPQALNYFEINLGDYLNLLTFFWYLLLNYIFFNLKIKFPHSSFEWMNYHEDHFKFYLDLLIIFSIINYFFVIDIVKMNFLVM